MKKNLFEIGTDFKDEWSSDNKKIKKNKDFSEKELLPPQKHRLHFAKEKRRGKVVTIVKPFYMEKKELQELLKILKKKLGTGGAIKENYMEFQGDISDKLYDLLSEKKYRFK
jgi:translation initiation factor 1